MRSDFEIQKLETLDETEGRRRRRRRRRRRDDDDDSKTDDGTSLTATTPPVSTHFDSPNAELVLIVALHATEKRLDVTASVLTALKTAVVTAITPAVLEAVNGISVNGTSQCDEKSATIATKLTTTLKVEELTFQQSDTSASILISFPEDNSWGLKAGTEKPSSSQYDEAFKSSRYISAVTAALTAAAAAQTPAWVNAHVATLSRLEEKSSSRSSLEAAFNIKLYLTDPAVGAQLSAVSLGMRREVDNTHAMKFAKQIAASLTTTFGLEPGKSYVQVENIARLSRRAKFHGYFRLAYALKCADDTDLCGCTAGADCEVQAAARKKFSDDNIHATNIGSLATFRSLMTTKMREHLNIGTNDVDHGFEIVSIKPRNPIEGDQAAGVKTAWVDTDVSELVIKWQIWSKVPSVQTLANEYLADKVAQDNAGVVNYRSFQGSLVGDVVSRLRTSEEKKSFRTAALSFLKEVDGLAESYKMLATDCVDNTKCLGYRLTFAAAKQKVDETLAVSVWDPTKTGWFASESPGNALVMPATGKLLDCDGTGGVFTYGDTDANDGCLSDALSSEPNVIQEYRVQYMVRFLNSAFSQVEKKVESLEKYSDFGNTLFQDAAKKELSLDKRLKDMGITITGVYAEGHSSIHFDDNNAAIVP